MSTGNIIFITIILIIYWIILLRKYEIDRVYDIGDIDAEELFKKYNPMVAGCIQGGRKILSRDLLAVILNLIDKKNIGLEIKQSEQLDKNYEYIIYKVPEKENEMDEIEKIIYNWLFDYKQDKAELSQAISKMPLNIMAKDNMEKLNNEVEKQLDKIGVNQHKVPNIIKIFNGVILIFAWLIGLKNMFENNFYFEINDNIAGTVVMLLYPIYPLVIVAVIKLVNILVKKFCNILEKYDIVTEKVFKSTALIVALYVVLAIFTLINVRPEDRYVLADEALLGVAILICVTDKQMLKNSPLAIEDYSKLNCLKRQMEDYTLLEEKDVEHIVFWGKYLAYAVSFGNGRNLIKRVKGLDEFDIADEFFDFKIETYESKKIKLF